jgi:hypothetical protein
MNRFFAHKPPMPEPDDEPIPEDEPEPEDDPVPHPDPVAAPVFPATTSSIDMTTRRPAPRLRAQHTCAERRRC